MDGPYAAVGAPAGHLEALGPNGCGQAFRGRPAALRFKALQERFGNRPYGLRQGPGANPQKTVFSA